MGPSNFKLSYESGSDIEQMILIEIFDKNRRTAEYINNE